MRICILAGRKKSCETILLQGITCKLNKSEIRGILLPESWQVWTAEIEFYNYIIKSGSVLSYIFISLDPGTWESWIQEKQDRRNRGRRGGSEKKWHDIIFHLNLCCKVDHAITALAVPVFPQKCPVSRGITTEHLTSSAMVKVAYPWFSIQSFKEHSYFFHQGTPWTAYRHVQCPTRPDCCELWCVC